MRIDTLLAVALLAGSAQAAEAPRPEPGQLRLLDLTGGQLQAVVPGAAYMQQWSGAEQSTALLRFVPRAAAPASLAFPGPGSELVVQLAGESEIVDPQGRRYVLREGDVVLAPANVRHIGPRGGHEARLLSVRSPARPQPLAADGAAPVASPVVSPGVSPAASPGAAPPTGKAADSVRRLFNVASVEPSLLSYPGGGVAFRHWHGEQESVAVTRLSAGDAEHVRAAHGVHGQEVAWVVRGQMRYALTGGPQVTAGAGQAVLLPPYRAHSAQCLTAECLIVSWHGPRRDEWGAPGTLPPLRWVTTGAGAVAAPVKTRCPCQAAAGEP